LLPVVLPVVLGAWAKPLGQVRLFDCESACEKQGAQADSESDHGGIKGAIRLQTFELGANARFGICASALAGRGGIGANSRIGNRTGSKRRRGLVSPRRNTGQVRTKSRSRRQRHLVGGAFQGICQGQQSCSEHEHYG